MTMNVNLPKDENLSEVEKKVMYEILKNREKYLKAFIAETGLKPSECKLIERTQILDSGTGLKQTTFFAMKTKIDEDDAENAEISNLKVLIEYLAKEAKWWYERYIFYISDETAEYFDNLMKAANVALGREIDHYDGS